MILKKIARQASGKTFQIALGGAGDPNKHPKFQDILKICRYYRIVPNLTTSGFNITDEEIKNIREYCGAVAVSWYSRLVKGRESNTATIEVLNRLLSAGCTTNIHFVVSNETINEAIYRLENNLFPVGINAVIFILYKPVGFGTKEKVLISDANLKTFLYLATSKKHPYKIGFDTCFTPALLKNSMEKIPVSCIDACEAGTFSMYIDSQLNAYPCSFGIENEKLKISLREHSIREVWNSEIYNALRTEERVVCLNCKDKSNCSGGCRIGLGINLC